MRKRSFEMKFREHMSGRDNVIYIGVMIKKIGHKQ